MRFSPLLIAERLGHEKVQTTMETYSHLYPIKQIEVANQLDELMPYLRQQHGNGSWLQKNTSM